MCIQQKGLRTRESGTEEEIEEPLDPAANLEDLRLWLEKQQDIREAVQELPPRCRSLIEMLYFKVEPLSYDEISEKLGIPVPSVGPNRARCLEKLRAKLRKRGIKE